MIPGTSFLLFMLFWTVSGVAAFFSDLFFYVWLLSALLLLPVIIVEAVFLRFFCPFFQVSRIIPTTLALDEKTRVQLVLHRTIGSYTTPECMIHDKYPDSFYCTAFPLRVDRAMWGDASVVHIEYELIPVQRGAWEFRELDLLYSSPLFFWKRKQILQVPDSGKTYPNYKNMLRLTSQALLGKTVLAGLKQKRQRGKGTEFHSLRDYQQGDTIRDIDWRASSRRGKTIVRQYQEEQDQQLIIMLDSGYRLHRIDHKELQFDSALNTAMMLSYVALKHQDSVGLYCFGNEERWVGPKKGMGHLNTLMNSMYDIQSAAVPSSPPAALEQALKKIKKRSFIIVISNFREEDNETLSWILPLIRKKHLLLLVSLKEHEAERCAAIPVSDPDSALLKAAAFSYLEQRKKLYAGWEHQGFLCLDSDARRLSSNLINQYLELKRSGSL